MRPNEVGDGIVRRSNRIKCVCVCVWLMSMFTYPSKAQNCIVKTSRHLPNNGFLNRGSIWDKPFIKLVSFASTSSVVHLCVFVEAFSLANSWGSLTSFFTCNLTADILYLHAHKDYAFAIELTGKSAALLFVFHR